MPVTGIICEYNPLHLGHQKQLDSIRSEDPDGGIVCLMSGNYVQRGKPAIVDKMLRAKAAVLTGADLVLELPVTAALSSAEGFASEGVRILGHLCQSLSFGAETANKQTLISTAQMLLSPAFPAALTEQLEKGLSFPAARQTALASLGADTSALSRPNDILATEYCKAILSQDLSLEPKPILRQGSYHDTTADNENPSATAVRKLMLQSEAWLDYVPTPARDTLASGTLHALSWGERAILAKLRTMSDEAFAQLPYGSEGLWRKLMHASRQQASLEAILSAVKSKRYTRTRLDRMVMCAFLGLTQQDLATTAPYVRILAFNDRGREIIRSAKDKIPLVNVGETVDAPYQQLENRCSSLYGLFSANTPDAPDLEAQNRVFYKK